MMKVILDLLEYFAVIAAGCLVILLVAFLLEFILNFFFKKE